MQQPPTPPDAPSPLKLQALRGARWTTYGTLANLLLQTAQLLVLARWLSPELLGLAAIALLVAQLATVFLDLGVGNALISAPRVTPGSISALWLLSFGGAALVAGGLMLGGDAIGAFYRRPDLRPLLGVVALSLLIAAPGMTYRALLQRELRFKTLAGVETLSAIAAAAVNLGLVLSGVGVIALAWGAVARTSVQTLGFIVPGRQLHPWARPDFARLGAYLRFGAYQLASVVLSFIGGQADVLLTGRLIGIVPLGLLDTARNLVLRPMTLTLPVMQRVMVPVMARVQAEPERLRQAFVRAQSLLLAVNLPVFVGMAVAADPLVRVLLGEQWLGAIPLVPLLAAACVMRVLTNTPSLLLLALGRARRSLGWNFALAVSGVSAVAIGAQWGLAGVAVAGVLQFAALVALHYRVTVRPLTGASLSQVLRPLLPYVWAAALAAVPAALAVHLIAQPLVALIAAALVYAGVYAFTLWRTHPEARELVQLIRSQGLLT